MLENLFPFKWQDSPLTYLGIKLTSDPKDLSKTNFVLLLHSVRSELDAWEKVQSTWRGRINILNDDDSP